MGLLQTLISFAIVTSMALGLFVVEASSAKPDLKKYELIQLK